MRLHGIFAWLALAACLCVGMPTPAVAAVSVQATVDRNAVELGDTVTLNLKVEGAAGNVPEPDLSALARDFTILGTSQNRSLSVVNGQTSSSLTIGVALRPNHVGTLEIPALMVAGARTAPLSIEVSAPNPNAAPAGNRDVFMQAQVTPTHGRVGQGFSYVVQLYYAININSGTLDEPAADGLEVRKLGDDINYSAVRGGREYHVLERRYALTPSRAGQIRIPSAKFQGESADPMDPNSFFGSSTPVSAAAPALTIDVQPPPADWGRSTWLPARALSLTLDGWPDANDPARVGVPFNLVMTLRATGLPATALPTLSMPEFSGAKAYPDKPEDSTAPDGPWLVGARRQAFAVVPQRAGVLSIPAVTVKWWNVVADRAELATIPAHEVTVLPAAGAAATGQMGVPATAATSAAAPAVMPAAAAPVAAPSGAMPWRWIALASVGLWALSVFGWWWQRHRRRRAPVTVAAPAPMPPSAKARRLAFLAAARGSDLAAQARTLLAWARSERPELLTLGAVAEALENSAQRAAIATLQRSRYAGADAPDAGSALAAAFKPGFAWRRAATPGGDGGDAGLPPLYPFPLD